MSRRIFFGAVAVRWLYDLILFAAMGSAGLMGADSRGYLGSAEILAANLLDGNVHGWAWLTTDLGIMPLYPWLVTINVLLFGSLAPLTTVLVQGAIDAGTCLLVHLIAKQIDPRFAVPAAVAAAINPTQIVLSGLVYNDTLFVFFVALFLAGAASWLRAPAWPAAVTTAIGLGLAALTRIVIAPWVTALVMILLAALFFRRQLRAHYVAQLGAIAVISCLAIAPILARNVAQYGAWSLTDQGGSHLALWVVPLVREAKDSTPWERGSADVEKRFRERFPQAADNPFVESQRYAAMGREELGKLGLGAVVKAWVVGAAINLASPAIIISPPIARLPRTGFYATTGHTTLEKIHNFLFRSSNVAYAWAVLLGIAGVGLWRLLQLCGLVALIRDRTAWPIAAFLVLWGGFILAASGPIASPKYRLPIEPVLCVLAGAGFASLRGRRSQASA